MCYRVPDSTKESDSGLLNLIEKVSNMPCVLIGDFNYHIDWNHRMGKRREDELFLECMDEHFLIQHVKEQTRGENISDLIISTEENMIDSVSVGEEFSTSDHRIIRFNMVMNCEIKLE